MNISREGLERLLETARRHSESSRLLITHLQVSLAKKEMEVEELQKQLNSHQASRCASVNSYAIAPVTSVSF